MNKYIYCSLFSHDDYLYPLIALMYSGKRTNSKYPYYLLVTENVSKYSRQIIKKLGYQIIEVNEWLPDTYVDMCKNFKLDNTDFGDGHGKTINDRGGRHTFTKFKAFDLVQFDKVLLLDCDILILKNIDDLFDYPSITSVSGQPNNFCSGCLLLKPNHSTYMSLYNFANHYTVTNQGMPYDDYMILKDYFNNLVTTPGHLFETTDFYNLFECNTNNPNLLEEGSKVRCIHMTGREKPGLYGSSGGHWGKEGYCAIMGYNYYLLILNFGIRDLKRQGIEIEEIV